MSAKPTLRKDGRYGISKYINGEKRFFYGKTIDEAEEKMWRAILSAKDGNVDGYIGNSITFMEVRNEWYNSKKKNIENATRKMYEVDCFPKLKPLEKKSISKINQNDISRIMDTMAINSNIAEKVYMTLNQIFNYAMKRKLIASNPMILIERPKSKTKNESKRGLTNNEKIVIENTEWNKRQELLLKLYLDYGLRKEEATALQKKNVNLDEKILIINHANDYTNNVPEIKGTKSDAGKRILPILDKDVVYFRNLIRDLKDDEFLLQMENGKPLTQNSYRQLWESVRRRMNKTAKTMNLEIPGDLNSRICRHEYSIKIMSLSNREQMYLMGHEDISTTIKNYQTINVNHIDRKELNRISEKKNGSSRSGKK